MAQQAGERHALRDSFHRRVVDLGQFAELAGRWCRRPQRASLSPRLLGQCQSICCLARPRATARTASWPWQDHSSPPSRIATPRACDVDQGQKGARNKDSRARGQRDGTAEARKRPTRQAPHDGSLRRTMDLDRAPKSAVTAKTKEPSAAMEGQFGDCFEVDAAPVCATFDHAFPSMYALRRPTPDPPRPWRQISQHGATKRFSARSSRTRLERSAYEGSSAGDCVPSFA